MDIPRPFINKARTAPLSPDSTFFRPVSRTHARAQSPAYAGLSNLR
jgi:hypothetical protein